VLTVGLDLFSAAYRCKFSDVYCPAIE